LGDFFLNAVHPNSLSYSTNHVIHFIKEKEEWCCVCNITPNK